jgi:uncharacterized protein YbcI
MSGTPGSPERRTSTAAAISNHVVHVFGEYTGRGPTNARTYMDGDVVTVILKDLLTKGERSLVEDGHTEQVLSMRLAFQQTMRDDLVAGLESLLERKVEAFLSANHTNPDIAIETFLLVPVDEVATG